ncbi:DUF4153 domain-containing protein [Shimia sp. NS0008-38b]|uniref:DUF4153 domain-containing protein n=1 Tax=Shimia sp. NS0008-38b TaxID=3127653 RepID=UPI0031094D4A
MHTQDGRRAAGRIEMALVGAVAGGMVWALIEKAPDIVTHPLAYLFVTSFVAGFFAVLLGLSGPHRVMRAALPAFGLSFVGACLITLSGLRFDTLAAFEDAGHPIIAWVIFLSVGTPFAASLLRDRHSLRDYVHLFDVSWSILVRYSAAWLFVGVFWAVLWLSDALLEIVGLTVIGDVMRVDSVAYVVTGISLGFGLSVVHEMRDYLSPFLVLRLLRLLVPVVLLVVVVFVAAAVLQEPGALFGDLSRAATILAVSLAMISLVSIALDRGDADAVQVGWMRLATAALAALLPVMSGLAIYALWLRVHQYGWTPARLAAACAAAVVAVYALCYLVSVILGRGWMGRIRQANIGIAALVLVLAAAWQLPILNAERISTDSQVARIDAGEVTPDAAALWEMQHDWGRAGHAGLKTLEQGVAGERVEFAEAIAAVRVANTPWELTQKFNQDQGLERATRLLEGLTVIADGADIHPKMMRKWSKYSLENWADICLETEEPGCVMVLGDFNPVRAGREGFLFIGAKNGNFDIHNVFEIGEFLAMDAYRKPSGSQQVTRDQVADIVEGRFEIAPGSHRSLWIGEFELVPNF